MVSLGNAKIKQLPWMINPFFDTDKILLLVSKNWFGWINLLLKNEHSLENNFIQPGANVIIWYRGKLQK